MWLFLLFSLAHRTWHLVVTKDFWHAVLHVQQDTILFLNLAVCLRYMKTWNYNRKDTMPISYTLIMVRSAGAKLLPEYSDRNLIVRTQCVKRMWLSGSCSATLVVSVSSKTRLTANPIITAIASATRHSSGCISVCPASFIHVTLIVTDTHSTEVSHISPRHLTVSECLSWTAIVTISLALWCLK